MHVGFLPANVEQVFYPDAELIGDIGANVVALADHLEGHTAADPAFEQLRPKILAHINEGSESSQFPIIPQRLVHDVRAVVPEDGIVCLDNGMYKIWFARNYRTRVANTLLLDNALATMGAGLPSAIMAKLLNPDRPVLAVCGDGGFMMNSQELETAVRLKLSLVVIIVVDGAYGMIRWKQAVDRFPDYGMTFDNPDFVTYAAAYGAQGHHVGSCEALAPTLRAALDAGGVHLVAVPVDYRENISSAGRGARATRSQRLSRSAPLGPAHDPHISAFSSSTEEPVGAIGLEPRYAHAGGHLESFQDLSRSRVDAPQITLITLPGAVPELAIHPRNPGDEAVRFNRAKNRSGLGIDLVNLTIAIFSDPERSFGPSEPRVPPAARRRDGGDHPAGLWIDLLDAILGELE